uniref:Uncharacterized protein n=1 Tax=Solanum lycopersicum TaxID=4081 RepID=K4DE29_SOLLC
MGKLATGFFVWNCPFPFQRILFKGIGSAFVSILREKKESGSRLLGQRFVPDSKPTNGNRDITICGRSREINMMSADSRMLSHPQKEWEATEHIPSHKIQALQRLRRAINGLLVDSKKES